MTHHHNLNPEQRAFYVVSPLAVRNRITGLIVGWVRVDPMCSEKCETDPNCQGVFGKDDWVVAWDALEQNLDLLYATEEEAVTAGIDKLRLAHKDGSLVPLTRE